MAEEQVGQVRGPPHGSGPGLRLLQMADRELDSLACSGGGHEQPIDKHEDHVDQR